MSKEDKIVFCTGRLHQACGASRDPGKGCPGAKKTRILLVGYDSRDDAAVYRITDDIALVQTVDFFPPMVDDPYTFGQIAATNALSDVYAMGGEVKTALNLVCFPEDMDLNAWGTVSLRPSRITIKVSWQRLWGRYPAGARNTTFERYLISWTSL